MNLPLEAAAFPPKTITRLTDEQQFVLSAFHWDKPNKSTEKKTNTSTILDTKMHVT